MVEELLYRHIVSYFCKNELNPVLSYSIDYSINTKGGYYKLSYFYKLSSCGLLQHYSGYYIFPLLSCLLSICQVLHVRYYYTCIMIHMYIQNMTHILWYMLYKWVYTLLITLLINIIIILYQLLSNNFWIYIIHFILIYD